MSNHTIHRNRRGLTLIELVVVMTILVALAGLLVPTFASMLTRGHTSTCSTNIGEVNKAVQEYQLLYGGYPNNLDALTDGSTLINYLANGAAYPPNNGSSGNEGGGQFTAVTPTAAEVTALNNAGLTTVQPMIQAAIATSGSGGFDPTFNYYLNPSGAASGIAITTSTALGGLDPTNNSAAAAICQKLGLPITGRYVALGIGSRCNMIGKTMASPPVHFGDTEVLNPEFGYERLVCIFKISDSALGGTYTTAQLVAVGPIHDDGLGSINDELQNWYQLQQGGS